jgi:hypothetical protein
MTQSFTVELQNGFLQDGKRKGLAELREPNGQDEASFADFENQSAGKRVTAVLAQLLLRIGDYERPNRKQIAQLSIGDRERLLFAIAARLLGQRFDLVTTCQACNTVIEVAVPLDQLIALQPNVPGNTFALASEAGAWSVLCKPLTGEDIENASHQGQGARRSLLLAGVVELKSPDGRKLAPHMLPVECETALETILAEIDPAAECRASITCPSCGAETQALIDGFTILKSAFGSKQHLYQDVYRMARSYHWSEAEILALPLQRRRHYLAIAETSGGLS